jgi:hypothetical protein
MRLQQRNLFPKDDNQMLQVQVQPSSQKGRRERQPHNLQFELRITERVIAECNSTAVTCENY